MQKVGIMNCFSKMFLVYDAISHRIKGEAREWLNIYNKDIWEIINEEGDLILIGWRRKKNYRNNIIIIGIIIRIIYKIKNNKNNEAKQENEVEEKNERITI